MDIPVGKSVTVEYNGKYCVRYLGNSPADIALLHPPNSLGPIAKLILIGTPDVTRNLEGIEQVVTPVGHCGWDTFGTFANNSNYLGGWFQLGLLHTPTSGRLDTRRAPDDCSTRS